MHLYNSKLRLGFVLCFLFSFFAKIICWNTEIIIIADSFSPFTFLDGKSDQFPWLSNYYHCYKKKNDYRPSALYFFPYIQKVTTNFPNVMWPLLLFYIIIIYRLLLLAISPFWKINPTYFRDYYHNARFVARLSQMSCR